MQTVDETVISVPHWSASDQATNGQWC